MQTVGHHLQLTAVSRTTAAEKDVFARSAYNRYYYASFLEARRMLSSMDKSWRSAAHKTYPEVLRGTIAKDFKRERQRAVKLGDFALEDNLRQALAAALGLAKLLERAYGTRVTADYEETAVAFGGANGFSLNTITITEAYGWHASVEAFCSVILSAWRQIH